eukprot:2563580-Pleurochrysis_carterae.AAC.1
MGKQTALNKRAQHGAALGNSTVLSNHAGGDASTGRRADVCCHDFFTCQRRSFRSETLCKRKHTGSRARPPALGCICFCYMRATQSCPKLHVIALTRISSCCVYLGAQPPEQLPE